MNKYRKMFETYNLLPSQVLVTAANFNTAEESQKSKKDTIETLLKHNVIPIINENDATATEELILGDNDQLSAYAAHHFGAELLVILSDIDAYYDKDPRNYEDAKVRSRIESITWIVDGSEPESQFCDGRDRNETQSSRFSPQAGRSHVLASGFDLSDAKSFFDWGATSHGGSLFKAAEEL